MGMTRKILQRFFRNDGEVSQALLHAPKYVQSIALLMKKTPKRFRSADRELRLFLTAVGLSEQSLVSKNIENSRVLFETRMRTIRSKKPLIKKIKDSAIKTNNGDFLSTRWYIPNGHDAEQASGCIMFFHGGFFTMGSLETHHDFCQYLCNFAKLPVVSVAYRLAPEHPAPAATDDGVASFTWLHQQASLNNNQLPVKIDPKQLFVAGDNAGATIATVVAQQTKQTSIAPKAQLLIYPITDFGESYHSYKAFGENLLFTLADKREYEYSYIHKGNLKTNDPRIAPIKGNTKNIAPAYIVTAELDLLVDEGEAYAHIIRLNNVPTFAKRFTGLTHGFVNLMTVHTASRKACKDIAIDFRRFVDGL